MQAPQELRAFIERERPRVVGALDLYVGDLATAEELANEAFVRVCERWEEVRRMHSPGGWTHRVAMNLARSYWRRRYAERRAFARAAAREPRSHEDPDGTDAVVLREALAALRPRQRQAVILRYYLDVPAAEVAELMGTTPGAVRVLTHRALERLRTELQLDGGTRTWEQACG